MKTYYRVIIDGYGRYYVQYKGPWNLWLWWNDDGYGYEFESNALRNLQWQIDRRRKAHVIKEIAV